MDDLSSRFLAAFNVVEDWMRHTLGDSEHQDFANLVRRLASVNTVVRKHSLELKRLARVRNLIAHDHSHVQPLAVPTISSVERIESLGKLFLSPPSLFSLAAKPVEMCNRSDPLGCCVRKMHDGLFSQIPIYNGADFCGLLTAETIARWLTGSFVGDGRGIVDEQPISEVMRYQEDSENVEFMAQTASVVDALAAFDKFMRRGKRLEAILLTNRGRRTDAPIGIVTIHDIPKLNNSIYG